MKTALALLVVTLIAAGVGALQGRMAFQLASAGAPAEARKAEAAAPGHGDGHGAAAPAPTPGVPVVRELKPIVTNLVAPAGVWVRLEGAIVADAPPAELDRLTAEVGADALAWLRTLTLADIEGADGLRRLREDLAERAAVRSNKRVSDVIIGTLVAQ